MSLINWSSRQSHILFTEVSPTSRLTKAEKSIHLYSQNSLQRLPLLLWPPSSSMSTVESSNSPEIKKPSTSCQHLSCPRQFHRIGAITTRYDRENTLIPQRHLTGSWKIQNQVQVCLTPMPMLLQPHHVQEPKRLRHKESQLQGGCSTMSRPHSLLKLVWVLLNFSFPLFFPKIF